MRIGIFTDTYPPYINGVSTSISMLENALRRKGHKVYIVTVNPEGMSYNFENNDRIIRIPGIPIGIYDYRLTGIYPIKAVNKIKELNLDVIHSHTEFGVGTFARIIAKQLDIPLVHTYHTMYEDYIHYITHGYFDKPSRKIVEYLTKFYCDKTAKELIVPTEKTYKLFKEKYQYDRNVHIIPTGIEIEKFYKEKINQDKVNSIRKELKIKKDDIVLLFVGRIAEEKSIDVLIKSQASICKKYKNCKLLIVGDGPNLEDYIELSKKYNIENNVIFTGKVSWKDINKYYNLSDIFVTASHTETQGLTLIEAMAASLPVIALNDESFKNVVINDLNGYLFNNDKEYEEYVISLIKNKAKRKKLGDQARINSETYSSKYYAERVLDVYYKAIGGRPKKNKKTFSQKLISVIKRGLNGE